MHNYNTYNNCGVSISYCTLMKNSLNSLYRMFCFHTNKLLRFKSSAINTSKSACWV